MSTPYEKRNEKLGQKLVKALETRHFEASYCATKEEAKEKALSYVNKEQLISWGGSTTLQEIGLLDTLRTEEYRILDRETAKTPEEKNQIAREAFLSDVYFASANGLSEDGQIVNIDGNGNRVAAITFGPKNVVLVVGINKVAKTVEDAMARAKNTAAPINAQRFSGMNTPCEKSGSCANCMSENSICCYFSTIRICRPAKKIKVIIVGEALGY